MGTKRREFLKTSALIGLASLGQKLFGNISESQLSAFESSLQDPGKFKLPELPYAYDALEPFIDKETMTLHHDKHHKAYVDKLNKALENYKGSIAFKDLFASISSMDVAVRNNGGGHYNHSLFWILMKAPSAQNPSAPGGELKSAILKSFGSIEEFKKQFSDSALKVFGSGWCWLIVDASKEVKICTTPNQDNPLMDVSSVKGTPILALDVWEHAYYLKYQNKRADYIQNWWSLVNWAQVEEFYADAMKG